MGENSKIAWTNHTFNPWWGCQRVSPGCQHCYAEALDKRVGGATIEGTKVLRWGPKAPRVRTSLANWKLPLKWNKAAEAAGERHRVFCASMADVFEQLQPGQVGDLDSWRLELFELIALTPHLDWLLLTKRPQFITRGVQGAVDAFERTAGCARGLELAQAWIDGTPPANVWLGTTVEDQQRAKERIPELLKVPAVVRFLSIEPLLERVDLDQVGLLWRLCSTCEGRMSVPVVGGGKACPDCFDHQGVENAGISWVIIGGESGPGARPFHVDWARDLIRQCRDIGVAPFTKQLGANTRTRNDDNLTGDLSDEGWGLCDDSQVEEDVNGYREEYQGADVRVRLRDPAGADPAEWPADLRVREFPR